MCGIIGATGKKPDVKLLSKLVSLNLDRGGQDGVGIWSNRQGLRKGLNITLDKELAKRKKDKNFLIHLRWATSGEVSARFCHPFRYKDIVFCHNGHIWNYKDWNLPMDSLAGLLFVVRNLQGIEKLWGSYVFAWYNLDDLTFNILNHNGEIQFGWENKTLYFASEGINMVIEKAYGCPNNTKLTFNSETGGLVGVQNLEKLLQKQAKMWSNLSKTLEDISYV